jgi:excinuclease ABC subunit A
MTATHIEIRGARQNNLKNVSLDLPLGRLIVVTGLSGSGKSSLALDTLYAEGQRRYIESLSTYARQFLERLPRPDVDAIRNIPPAIAIVQYNPVKTSRSTVGTATEVYDYLRLLWAKVGTTWCRDCDRPVQADSPSAAAARALRSHEGARAYVVFPLVGADEARLGKLPAQGFLRLLVGGQVLRVPESGGELEALSRDLAKAQNPAVVVDRLEISGNGRSRLAEAIETAFGEGGGIAEVRVVDGPAMRFALERRCGGCDRMFEPPTTKLFSFNSPFGACPACKGFGNILTYDEKLIVPDPDLSLARGAIDPFMKPSLRHWQRRLMTAAKTARIDVKKPWVRLNRKERDWVLRGERTRSGRVRRGGFRGVLALQASRSRLSLSLQIAGSVRGMRGWKAPARGVRGPGGRTRHRLARAHDGPGGVGFLLPPLARFAGRGRRRGGAEADP